MNTDKFDKHAKDNLSFYEGFLSFTKYSTIGIVIILIALAWLLL